MIHIKKDTWIILKIVISLGLLGYVLHQVNFESLLERLSLLSWSILLVLPILSVFHVMAETAGKKNIFDFFSFPIKFGKLFRLLYKGAFYGFFMPSIIGSDAYFILIFGKSFKSYARMMTGIIVYKVISLSIFVMIAGFTSLLLGQQLWGLLQVETSNLILYMALLSLVMLVTVLIMYLSKRTSSQWLKSKISSFADIKQEIMSNKTALVRVAFFAVIFYSISIGSRLLLAIMLGIDIPVLTMMMIIIMVNLIVMLPVTISGIGLREASYIFMMKSVGISSNEAILMSFFDFLISFSGVIIGGITVLYDDIKAALKRQNSESVQKTG